MDDEYRIPTSRRIRRRRVGEIEQGSLTLVGGVVLEFQTKLTMLAYHSL